jgi:CHC2 zinc finger/Toprim-like
MTNRHRLDWHAIKARIDLTAVATTRLGPAPKRSGRRLLWHCPFHDDRNPSFEVDPQRGRWKCWPCDKGGDAATLVMQLDGVRFPEAVRWLAAHGGLFWEVEGPRRKAGPSVRREGDFPTHGATNPGPRGRAREAEAPSEPASPKGLAPADARALVEEAERRLWSVGGRDARAYLTAQRGLTEATIRRLRLGWTLGVDVPRKDGDGTFRARGVVIPWFDGDRLCRVTIRQPDGFKLRYAQAFCDRAAVYPDREAIRRGSTLIVVEGEFDAMLLGQELGDLASVATFGSSSNRPDLDARLAASVCPVRFAAHDADASGDRAAAAWSVEAQRVRPPIRPPAGKDWTDAMLAGIDLRRWWVENHFPDEWDREKHAVIMEGPETR